MEIPVCQCDCSGELEEIEGFKLKDSGASLSYQRVFWLSSLSPSGEHALCSFNLQVYWPMKLSTFSSAYWSFTERLKSVFMFDSNYFLLGYLSS